MESILIALISKYNENAFTHNYIYGFVMYGNVYYYNLTGLHFIKLDKQSSKNGGGYSLRYKPTKKDKENLIKSGICKVLCSEDYFINAVANSKYNKGEIFEKLITEKSGQVWEKDNVPFYKGADLTVNNIAYSIKFEKATICTENTLIKLK